MSRSREVAREGCKASEVLWKDAGRDRQRTFSRKREAKRFAAKVENTIAESATSAPLGKQTSTVAEAVEASPTASEAKLKVLTYRSSVQGHDRCVPPTSGRRRTATANRGLLSRADGT